ncbi:MAG: TRAP transporter small permease [Deltaproteobacteria bacterium]|nr:TRAP transporter small permease [Deltaproteobacteria bacterium]
MSFYRVLEKVSEVLNRVLLGVAGFFVAAMIVLTCANICFRILWVPVSGTFELMGYFGAVATALALGFTQIKRGHIAVDIVVQRFPKRLRTLLAGINGLVCMAFFGVVTWQIAEYAITLFRTGEVTETLRIVYYPFTFAVALGFGVLCLVLLTDFLRAILAVEAGPR